jgi:glycyl-tRNA synthetase
MAKNKKNTNEGMDKLVSLAKRRGFVFQSSEVYGGINSCWDYGPLGIELKRNIKELWWRSMVHERDDIEGLDASILMHPKVWHASGHVEGFTDPLVDCKKCKQRFRADQLETTPCPNKPSKMVSECDGELTEPRNFNLMFKTFMGPVEDESSVVFLRPETAQGIYVNFHNVQKSSRQQVPFGIAQIGKAFRNEITPGNFIFRTREFEQMEMQFFVRPGADDEWMEFWQQSRLEWYDRLGVNKDKLRFHPHGPNELAHYAKAALDIEYEFPIGWQELEGIHNRTDFDLSRHQEHSGKNLLYFDQAHSEKYIPYIIETSAGCDRTLLAVMSDAYDDEEERVVMRFKPSVAPIKVAVLPLVKKDGMPEVAQNLCNDLKKVMKTFYDAGGSIGRRYRRQDEAGTPFGITVDGETLENQTVTLRERDSMAQERVAIDQVKDILLKRIAL